MKYFLLLFLITSIINGACKHDCEGFDIGRNVNKWHWFPNDEMSLNFQSEDGGTISFNRADYDLTSESGGYGTMQKCPTKIHYSSYLSSDSSFQFSSQVSYDSEHYSESDHDSYMKYEINFNSITFYYDNIELNPSYTHKEVLTDTLYNSYQLNGVDYDNLYELKNHDLTLGMCKIWFQQYVGIIGVEFNDTSYIKL